MDENQKDPLGMYHTKDLAQKRKELLRMDDRALIDRILAFPDRERLNRDEDGKRRKYPSGEMAVRARRSMEKDPDWGLSDKQRFAMADSFARYSTNELKVSGIKFTNADPNTLVKTEIRKEGVKSVYSMQFTLIPEPENQYDKNAVAVYVEDEDPEGDVTYKDVTYNGVTRIGYLPSAYVAEHPITDPISVKGTLTDHSNGHFKTISYTMNLDTEEINKMAASVMDPDKYTYAMPFILNGDVDKKAGKYLTDQRDWTRQINDELEYWSVNGRVDNIRFEFPADRSGNIIVESSNKLSTEAMTVCGSYFRYSLESGISGDLKREGYVDVPANMPAVNTRDKTYFSLQAEPKPDADFMKAVDNMDENPLAPCLE